MINFRKSVFLMLLAVILISFTACSAGPNKMVQTEDAEGDVAGFWLGLWHGFISLFTFIISLFNENIKIYDHNDGLLDTEFYDFCTSPQGELFIGHANGFTSIIPDSIKNNQYIPPVVLTKFLILNKQAKLDTVIGEKKHVTLTHTQNEFSFEFAALNYIASQKNKYRYKMEEFDKDWIDAGTRRFASYTNLAPGDYTFRVLGSNNDDV